MTDQPNVITLVSSISSPNGQWSPVQGLALTNLLESSTAPSDDEKERLVQETVSILSECVPPNAKGAVNAGLIIGYVQSGKTLSFTSLAALARDNSYQLVILLAGTTNNLVEQNSERLKEDLKLHKTREWNYFTTLQDRFGQRESDRVKTEFEKWHRTNKRARTVLIVCMKQHQHLEKLTRFLGRNSDFSDVPTLIIDDEGDQVSMNTKAKRDEESTTYFRIKEMRALFPHHSYVLYTATPQAPLLISRIDSLSPDFAKVLTPGQGYVGGQEFFIDSTSKYIELIPYSDVPDVNEPPQKAPESLYAALRDFFTGVAIGLLEGEFEKLRNRSMMIHPGVQVDGHLMFMRWVRMIKDQWKSILGDTSHPDHVEELEKFRKAARGILATYDTSLIDEDIIGPKLFEAISDTAVEELNARENNQIPSVDWAGEYSWILIGGIGLDRGFTVEGLTVSYMPRTTGVGNVDNIQQRARFFGYKKSYLGLCRLYLTRENIDVFTDYVKHEESIRSSISDHIRGGKSLKEWRRVYFLDESLKPTRSSVILLDMYKLRRQKGWIVPNYPFLDSEFCFENLKIVDKILETFDFRFYYEDGWNDEQKIPAFSDRLSLAELVPMIGEFRYTSPDDSLQHTTLMMGLQQMIKDDPALPCSFYALSERWSGIDTVRTRTLTDKNPPKIKSLFQGRNPRTNYPGARALKSEDNVTFQIHRYDIRTSDNVLVEHDVPILAVHIPNNLMGTVWVER